MPTNFLTKEGFQKLQEELDYLRTPNEWKLPRDCTSHGGGELIENAEYEVAKNEQAFGGRIQELIFCWLQRRSLQKTAVKTDAIWQATK